MALVPKVRVELTRGYPHRFLRPARLPFRHFGRMSKIQLIIHCCGHLAVKSLFKNTIVYTTVKVPGFHVQGRQTWYFLTHIDRRRSLGPSHYHPVFSASNWLSMSSASSDNLSHSSQSDSASSLSAAYRSADDAI